MVCRETEASIAARLQAQRYETSNGIKQPNCRSSVAIKNGWSYTAASLTSSCCGLGQLYFWIEVNGKLHSPFALSPVKEALFISWTGGKSETEDRAVYTSDGKQTPVFYSVVSYHTG